MTQIKWTNATIKLCDLIPWERNPRYSTEVQAERITDSHRVFGQAETLAIDAENNVLNGHQRLNAWLAEYGPDFEIDARKADKVFDEAEKQAFTATLHAAAVGSWDFTEIANWGWDADELASFGFDSDLLMQWKSDVVSLSEMLNINTPLNTMKRREQGYNESSRDIEPIKLAHRIEAIWQAENNLAIDFFSGEGGLAFWYRRRFKNVITIDKKIEGVDYVMEASEFIENHLGDHINYFDFVDFDDEGTPAREITLFFDKISGVRNRPFYLALTDGNGLNLKIHSVFDFGIYCTGDNKRKATSEDYYSFEDIVAEFIKWRCSEAGFTPTMLSNYRGREGNVVFQTWFIDV